jgi:hypothetical protein
VRKVRHDPENRQHRGVDRCSHVLRPEPRVRMSAPRELSPLSYDAASRQVRCEDRALAARYNQLPPDFTVQYGCIEHPEMMGGSLGAMLRGENPAAGALP